MRSNPMKFSHILHVLINEEVQVNGYITCKPFLQIKTVLFESSCYECYEVWTKLTYCIMYFIVHGIKFTFQDTTKVPMICVEVRYGITTISFYNTNWCNLFSGTNFIQIKVLTRKNRCGILIITHLWRCTV